MSTTLLQDQDVNTSTDNPQSLSDAVGVSSETITFAVTKDLNNPKAALGFSEYKEGNATFKAANPGNDKDGNPLQPEIEVLNTITVEYPVAHSFDGIKEIMANEEDEAVSIFNTGAFNKNKAQLRAKFTQVNEAGDLINTDTSVTYDESKDVIATPLKRRNLTDTQRLMRDLKGYDSNTMLEALRKMGIIPGA